MVWKICSTLFENSSSYTNHTGLGVGDDIVIVRLNNGSNIIFDGYGQGSILGYFGVNISEPSTIIVFIDANGDNSPNIIGKDIYAAVYTSNGLVAAGDSMTPEEVRENCSTAKTGANAGYYCLKHVKNNGWEIDKDVWKAKVKWLKNPYDFIGPPGTPSPKKFLIIFAIA